MRNETGNQAQRDATKKARLTDEQIVDDDKKERSAEWRHLRCARFNQKIRPKNDASFLFTSECLNFNTAKQTIQQQQQQQKTLVIFRHISF